MTKKIFLGDDFLLENQYSVELYNEYAAKMPIVDYHNHLSPKDIADNRKFTNITELWLDGDHYKWRAMRINGIAEKYCTGDASPREKFHAWAKTVPATMRNPLYHWTHLELKRYFGIDKALTPQTADEIFDRCNELLQQKDFHVRGLLGKANVELVCTTDDPTDALEHHQKLAAENYSLKMFPSFRPDASYATDNTIAYNNYLDDLAAITGTSIATFDDLIEALNKRINFFNSLGCRSADHGLEYLFFDANAIASAPIVFRKIRAQEKISADEKLQLRCAVLIELCKSYYRVGWVQQFHLGPIRATNSRMLRITGKDSGFDSIGEFLQASSMATFFDHLDSNDHLGRTIIYNSNPAHNEVFASMIGNFSDGTEPGKFQYGASWWFLDQKEGIEKQLNALSNMALLSRFVGMVTDSRSFLSFSRHEYFRRILCNLIGKDIANGELPHEMSFLGKMVQDICYHNTKTYFRF